MYGEKGVYLIRPVDVKAEFTAIAVGSRCPSKTLKTYSNLFNANLNSSYISISNVYLPFPQLPFSPLPSSPLSRFQSEAFKKSQLIDEEENIARDKDISDGMAGGSAGGGTGGGTGGASGGSNSAKAAGMSLARPDLHVHLQLGSELQLMLDSPKILRLIDLLRTFITFVVRNL